ncbi:hypothetical protein RCO28_34565 [Streptomyces sp. LHD-70]|uniref:DUF6166 domain-containing protein n=1 Tax=Streptomyces sp. LHD-70 TaxID=3072140 RepID=UPI0028109717|nr:DUF6166 domain-containing protein [Streptomyces sp. LHD-70]MDQ8707557.1 hypothetical protein [Streptomyces sp. LHD-70]
MTEQDRTYHGVHTDDVGEAKRRVLVETTESGPTERQLRGRVLYELTAKDAEALGGFHWGYGGSGPGRAADAILADALDLGDPWASGFNGWPVDPVLQALSLDFVADVLSQCCAEWRISRATVLRWCRGWYAQQGIEDLPEALADLPELASSRLEQQRLRRPGTSGPA